MSSRFKSILFLFIPGLITLPFILVTDLFPFMRFGMFAEPIKHQVQQEEFRVYLQKNDSTSILNPVEIGFEEHTYEYISRNYFYRGEGILYLEKISSLLKEKPTKLELRRYISSQVPDTIVTLKR